MEEETAHPIFLNRTRRKGQNRPTAENLYFALLLRAERSGTLSEESAILHITLQLAEAQLRRFKLERIYKRRQVERVATIFIDADKVESARLIARNFRFSLLGSIGK